MYRWIRKRIFPIYSAKKNLSPTALCHSNSGFSHDLNFVEDSELKGIVFIIFAVLEFRRFTRSMMGLGTLLFFCNFFWRSGLLEYWILWYVRGHCLGCPPNYQWGGTCNFDRLSTSVGVLWHRCVVRQWVSYLSCRKRSATTDMSSSWAFLTVLCCLSSCLNEYLFRNSPGVPFRLSTQYALRKHTSRGSVKAWRGVKNESYTELWLTCQGSQAASYTQAADVKYTMRSRIAETADTNIRYMGFPLSVLWTQLESAWLFRWPEHIEAQLGSRPSSRPKSDGHSWGTLAQVVQNSRVSSHAVCMVNWRGIS